MPAMKFRGLAAWAARLTSEVGVLWFAARDPGCPPWLRWVTLALVAYALSPIDLIPDFIPILGWLDDLVILPLGLAWVMRRMPPAVLDRARAQAAASRLPRVAAHAGRLGSALRWGLWLVGLLLGLMLLASVALAWALWRWASGA
jgi:uncharacterized membrane protein YkvA (DUF1232 family)